MNTVKSINFFKTADVCCPGCRNRSMSIFFENQRAPVFCNVLWETRQAALAAPRATIRLAYCRQCGLIYNIAFAPVLLKYNEKYENSLHFSARFRQYAEDLAYHLVRRHQLYQKDVVEIGCGQGDFLNLLADAGNNRAVGFDPSYDEQRSDVSSRSQVKILSKTYSKEAADYPADIICCRHVLEHIASPLDFLRTIRRMIGDRKTIVFFEVPNAMYTLKDMGIWDIIYEHCSYFTLRSLACMVRNAGFEPIEVKEQYDGQFLTIEARPADNAARDSAVSILPDPQIENLILNFTRLYQTKTAEWHKTLSRLKQDRRRSFVWGAGSKGITFLNTLNVSHHVIEYVVDQNPYKDKRFLTGTGQQVLTPAVLPEHSPEVIVIMNPIYHQEIKQTLQEMNLTVELLPA